MGENFIRSNRRTFLKYLAGVGAGVSLAPVKLLASGNQSILRRKIPSSKETLPVIGMGTWITFNVRDDRDALANRTMILKTFLDRGGALVDSSPMYGSAEEVIGHCLRQIENTQNLFAATKVWTWGKGLGISQMEKSRELWGIPRFDLMQIHNLLDWETHLETLREWKKAGRIRYIGITTSHGRRHRELESIMKSEPLDFVQFTYNLIDREAEQRLLPLATERGIAVIINRPFQGGGLFDHVKGRPLPGWASEMDCNNWAQFFLKFIVSHPAVTCAIPATSQLAHMQENMGAGYGVLPDPAMRKRMVQYFNNL